MFFLIMSLLQGYFVSLQSATGFFLGIASTVLYWFYANIAYPNEPARNRFQIGVTYYLGSMVVGFFIAVLLFKHL